jgi:hypothetical protein
LIDLNRKQVFDTPIKDNETSWPEEESQSAPEHLIETKTHERPYL